MTIRDADLENKGSDRDRKTPSLNASSRLVLQRSLMRGNSSQARIALSPERGSLRGRPHYRDRTRRRYRQGRGGGQDVCPSCFRDVNVVREKKQINVRAARSDATVRLVPHHQLSLGQALELIRADECVEVTPDKLRLHKAVLHAGEWQKLGRAAKRG